MKQFNIHWINDDSATVDMAVVSYKRKSDVRHVVRTVSDKSNITIDENNKLMALSFTE